MIIPSKALGIQAGCTTACVLAYLHDPAPLYIICIAGCVMFTVRTFTKWVEHLCQTN